ncbi:MULTISPECIES: hypothetical protein [unclassified Aureispira]|uniref:hypothetical protein n=1 Tax=unclassified Aureispira TaxID=2649989 RepID=UPI0006989093|nr:MULTISPECIES: hypothetical protein [unclassified Aureispira]WMX12891.1 hypothetical protein QP953_18810 [Aureispira sp. CCB-E]
MEYRTRALIIKVRPDDIVEILPNKEWTEPDTLEIAQENVAAMRKAVDGKVRGLLSNTANTYLSKEVLKCYSEAEIGEVATAMLTTSFGSKIVGNLFLKITGKSKLTDGKRGQAPVKIFDEKKRDEAIKWLLECIEKKKNG